MLVKFGGRDDFVDESQLFGFSGGYCFSGHDQFEGSSETNHSRQEVATSRIWYQAYSDEGLFEARLLRGYSDIAGEGEARSASCCDTVQTGGNWFLDISNPGSDWMIFFPQMISQ